MSPIGEPKLGPFDWEPELTPEQRVLADLQAAIYMEMFHKQLGAGMPKSYWDLFKATPPSSLDNGRLGTGILHVDPPTKLPPKICKYRKSTIHWYGSETPKYSLKSGAAHFEIKNLMSIPGTQLSMWPVLVGKDEEVDPLQGRRFVAVSEPNEQDKLDSDFLHRITGDPVTTQTFDKGGYNWSPQAKMVFMSGSKPPQINDKSKETD